MIQQKNKKNYNEQAIHCAKINKEKILIINHRHYQQFRQSVAVTLSKLQAF